MKTLLGVVGLLMGVVAACAPAGSTFSGHYAFINRSGIDCYEMTTKGFDTVPEPGAGRFERGQNASMLMRETRYPDTVTVLWGYKPDGAADQSQVVDLKAIPPQNRKGWLVFEFHPNRVWTARFDAAEFPK